MPSGLFCAPCVREPCLVRLYVGIAEHCIACKQRLYSAALTASSMKWSEAAEEAGGGEKADRRWNSADAVAGGEKSKGRALS